MKFSYLGRADGRALKELELFVRSALSKVLICGLFLSIMLHSLDH